MNVKPKMYGSTFDGIHVSIMLPYICCGTRATYYVDSMAKSISRMSEEFYDKLKPFFDQADEGYFSISVGRKTCLILLQCTS